MLRRTSRVDAWRRAFPLALLLLLEACARWSSNSAPSISFTRVPVADEGDHSRLEAIEGRAVGARRGQEIVLYTKSEELWGGTTLHRAPIHKN